MLQLIGRENDLVIATLEEEVDLFTSDEVRAAGERLLDDGCRFLVLDTSLLTYIDSSGITALLALWQRLEQRQGALVMAVPDGHLRHRMIILGLDSVFVITVTLHEAIARAHTLDAVPRPRALQTETETA
ncbi:STAS domain-containing protein [Streptomyces sp. NPDC017936]|uniref:STAS domain-containing protein n=1 Tax=Streptomyces sp. NPDC017936 TaxID=3365016 RepID=UPI0037BC14EF